MQFHDRNECNALRNQSSQSFEFAFIASELVSKACETCTLRTARKYERQFHDANYSQHLAHNKNVTHQTHMLSKHFVIHNGMKAMFDTLKLGKFFWEL